MDEPIDFTAWTDAQLDAGLNVARRFGTASLPLMEAEKASRAGRPSDGSHERVEALLAHSRTRKRRER